MQGCDADAVVISGLGVTSAIAQGRPAFTDALLAGSHRFGVMQRAGRQVPDGSGGVSSAFIGAEIDELVMPDAIPPDKQRNATWSAQVALATLHEAWADARLHEADPERVGLIVGGSNVQQRDIVQTHDRYRDRVEFLRPTYAMTFMDSDLCGLCSEVFGIRGLAFTVGGASASGQLAVIQAIEAVRCGQVDVCIALGAMMDLSYYECQAFRSVGAMGADRFMDEPALACRPFDRDHDGFIFGEACGAVVIERAGSARRTARTPYGTIHGWALAWDANRNPNPSLEGEMTVIRRALAKAELGADAIDYVNPHGTASVVGDDIELEALRRSGLTHARINTTKSIVGHGLTAAGIVELISILVQMEAGKLHPSRNLDHPIDPDFGWVRAQSVDHRIEHALNMSMGFGGINTALCVGRW
jgi:malonyl-ACP decarboxylase